MKVSLAKTVTRLGLVGALALSSLSLTACSEDDVAIGAAILLAVALSDDDAPPPPPKPPRHDHDDRDRWDRDHDRHDRDDRDRRDGPGRRPHQFAARFELPIANDVVKVSSHFQVPVDAGAKILNALRAAKTNDLTELQKLGIEQDELKKMANDENPSASTLMQLSQSLDLDLGTTHEVIQQIKSDLKSVR
jgi:hypothetical protein